MPPVVAMVIVLSVALGLLAVVGPIARLRAPGAAAILTMLLVGGLVSGELAPLDLVALPSYLGVSSTTLGLVLWTLLGLLGAAAGGPRLPGPAPLRAALSGLLLGEVGAALSFLAVEDRRARARLVLAAMAGSLLGRTADPAVLALSTLVEGGPLVLVPLGIVGLLISGVRKDDLPADHGRTEVSLAALPAALGALVFPGLLLPLLGLSTLAMAALAVRQRRAPAIPVLVWVLGGLAVAVLSIASGLPHVAVVFLELFPLHHQDLLAAGVAVVSVLLAALLDGPAAAVLGRALADQALGSPLLFPRPDGLALAVMGGLAVGGLGPLHLADVLRPALLRWLLLVVLTVLYIAWVLS